MLKSNSVGVCVPKVAAASLNSLSLLVTQDNLNNVLVSFLPALFESGLYGVSYLLANWIEIGGRILLFWYKFILKDSLNDLPGFGRLELLAMFGLNLVFVGGAVRFLRHSNYKFYIPSSNSKIVIKEEKRKKHTGLTNNIIGFFPYQSPIRIIVDMKKKVHPHNSVNSSQLSSTSRHELKELKSPQFT